MAIPALRRVMNATLDWLTDEIGAGVAVVLERAEDEPFRDEELPLVNISCEDVSFSFPAYGTCDHTAGLLFDIYAPSTGASTISADQAMIASAINSRIEARTETAGTLGYYLMAAAPVALGPDRDEYRLSDHGRIRFVWTFAFRTPATDFNSICAADGSTVS